MDEKVMIDAMERALEAGGCGSPFDCAVETSAECGFCRERLARTFRSLATDPPAEMVEAFIRARLADSKSGDVEHYITATDRALSAAFAALAASLEARHAE